MDVNLDMDMDIGKKMKELCWTTCVRDTVSDIRKAHQTNFY